MHLPKVSIIIPNYNHKPYLQQRLDSVLGQTFQDFEVIVLDDASTDGSQEVLKAYNNHPKVSHMVFNDVNSGSPFKQWQKGIALAHGEWIWIAESDDYCELDFLSTLLSFYESDTSCVLLYCATKHKDEISGKMYLDTWASAMDEHRWNNSFINTGQDEVKRYFRYRNIIPNASGALFKKEAVLNVRLPLGMNYCGDWQLWLQLLSYGSIGYVSKPMNYFRKHKDTTRTFKLLESERTRFNEYYTIIQQYSTFLDRLVYLNRYNWIVLECYLKKRTLGRFPNVKLKLPIELQLAYCMLVVRKKLSL